MKGTENIIAHIRADANDRSDAILAQAERQCDQIRSDYEKKAQETYTAKIRAGVEECQARIDGMDRIARMEAKKSVLALKQQLVSQCFEKACEKIVALPTAQYAAFLAKLAARASVTGDEEIILNAADRKLLGKEVTRGANVLLKDGKLRLSDEVGSFAGGLILRRGSIETNCTVELLVELQRSEMSAGLAKMLFD